MLTGRAKQKLWRAGGAALRSLAVWPRQKTQVTIPVDAWVPSLPAILNRLQRSLPSFSSPRMSSGMLPRRGSARLLSTGIKLGGGASQGGHAFEAAAAKLRPFPPSVRDQNSSFELQSGGFTRTQSPRDHAGGESLSGEKLGGKLSSESVSSHAADSRGSRSRRFSKCSSLSLPCSCTKRNGDKLVA